MLLQFTFEKFHLGFHLFVLVDQLFHVLGLVFEFTGELDILLNRQLSGSLQLLFIHGQHLNLNISDINQHLFPEFINSHRLLFGDIPHIFIMLVPLNPQFVG